MGLVKKASKLLEGVRRHKNVLASNDQYKQEDLSLGLKARFGRLVADRETRRRKATVEAGDSVTHESKRERMMMTAQEVFSVHENPTNELEIVRKPRHMIDTQQIQIVEDKEEESESESESDQYNDGESDDEADESVIEDMRKLEENFKGISRKYRLINRIGEGILTSVYNRLNALPTRSRYILDCIQS